MSEKFIQSIKAENNLTTTHNGATALKTTNSNLVDMFGTIGAMRNSSCEAITDLFIKAFSEDKLIATKMLFYARDVRNSGLGERRVFKESIKFLANVHPEIIIKNMQNIPMFGRYDDLYALIGTPAESAMWDFVRTQLNADIDAFKKGESISLLAKWLKSTNTSSKESVKIGRLTAKTLGYSEIEYRRLLSMLRNHIDVVERKMSNNDWQDIKYEAVPSNAMNIYRNSFVKHDRDGFTEYIEAVKSGDKKINASTLFPYDILEKMCSGNYFTLRPDKYDEVLEAQWKSLPNYIDGENNILVMADTSASMNGRPMATAIGLAMYFAERNKGVFSDVFMTFSRQPSFVKLVGDTLYEKIRCVPSIVQNTNLEAAFELILETAVKNNLTMEDMPKSLVVVSDMQFDAQTTDRNMTWHNAMVKRFSNYGYEFPNIIYWNVNSTKSAFQVTSNYKGVQLASGQSPSVFKSILNNIGKTPYEAMINTLENPVYDCITV